MPFHFLFLSLTTLHLHISEIMLYLSFCHRFIPVSITSSNFIHVTAWLAIIKSHYIVFIKVKLCIIFATHGGEPLRSRFEERNGQEGCSYQWPLATPSGLASVCGRGCAIPRELSVRGCKEGRGSLATSAQSKTPLLAVFVPELPTVLVQTCSELYCRQRPFYPNFLSSFFHRCQTYTVVWSLSWPTPPPFSFYL